MTLIGGGLFIWMIVKGQKALAKQREEQARKDAAIEARAAAALAAKEQRKIDAQAEYDAITKPRRERWLTYEAEINRLTAEARGNPPLDLHRIAWEQSSHSYKVLRWWVAGGEQTMRWIMSDRDYHDYDVGGAQRIPFEEKDLLKALLAEVRGLDPTSSSALRYIDVPYTDRYEPPEVKARCGYKDLGEERFRSVKDAEHWLFLELHPDENQRGYDMDGRHITDEVVPLPRPTIQGLPSLVLGSASAVVDDSDLDFIDVESLDSPDPITRHLAVARLSKEPGEFVNHRLSRNRPSTRYKDL